MYFILARRQINFFLFHTLKKYEKNRKNTRIAKYWQIRIPGGPIDLFHLLN